MAVQSRKSAKQKREERGINLRLRHLGLSLPGQALRLDLYRLVCYFHTSEHLSGLANWGEFCPWQRLREFEEQEIMRILLQTAAAVRYVGFGHADPMRSAREALEEPVGKLYRDIHATEGQELPLREACNKIIHAKNIVLDSNEAISADDRFIKPTIFCYDDFMQEKSWKAVIDLLPFVEHCDTLMNQFG